MEAGADRRRAWERRWQQRRPSEPRWFRPKPPPEFVRLLEGTELPNGAALDLGCGAGIVTAHLARRFRPAVGMDIALGAVQQARRHARAAGLSPAFVHAEAPILPFRSEAFAFVFDRGCLLNIRRKLWPKYFREVERVLKPRGMLQVYGRTLPPLFSRLGMRLRVKRLVRRRAGHFPDRAPTSMTILTATYAKRSGPGLRGKQPYSLFRKEFAGKLDAEVD